MLMSVEELHIVFCGSFSIRRPLETRFQVRLTDFAIRSRAWTSVPYEAKNCMKLLTSLMLCNNTINLMYCNVKTSAIQHNPRCLSSWLSATILLRDVVLF